MFLRKKSMMAVCCSDGSDEVDAKLFRPLGY